MISFRSVVAFGLVGLASILSLASVAVATERPATRPYLAFSVGSYHVDAARNFEETNPGIGLGFTRPWGKNGTEIAAEIGQYRNSLGDQSQYVTGAIDTPIAQIGERAELRMGGFAGVARYKNAAQKFAKGIPTMGDWVVVGGAQVAVRLDDRHEVRLRVLPAGNAAKAVLTLQVATHF